jgi:mannose-1-phosphate guanylyltransferase
VEYGWVEPGAPLGGLLPDSVRHVGCFWEKPARPLAFSLMKSGCLWNSFVMVGKIDTFLALIQRALPKLIGDFESIRPMLFTEREDAAVQELYSGISSSNFSDEVLSTRPYDLAVICGSSNLGWSDLGETNRVLSVLASKRVKPEWLRESVGESNLAR